MKHQYGMIQIFSRHFALAQRMGFFARALGRVCPDGKSAPKGIEWHARKEGKK